MTGSQRNKLAAIGVFAMLTIVVSGGITWATIATLQLAKRNVMDEHERQVSEALMLMDVDIKSVLNVEAGRSYTDYRARYAAHAVTFQPRENVEVDAFVFLPSPLAEDPPPHDWIDLHFQVDPDGNPSSPQVPHDGTMYSPEKTRGLAGCNPRVCRTWAWFATQALPWLNLAETAAPASDDEAGTRESSLAGVGPIAARDDQLSRLKREIERRIGTPSDYSKRRRSFHVSQGQHLPPKECVPPRIAEWNIRVNGVDVFRPRGFSPSPGLEVEVETGPFGDPIWLKPEPEEGPKLAFVRECYQDDIVFHQGFVADWGRLRASLLDDISEVFPEAELVPVTAEEARTGRRLQNLPVRLVVRDVSDEAVAAAWDSVGGTLITTWIAAAGILLVAGAGLWNLVSLTERRMQFAYAVTHELRTPLTTFRLYTDMLSAGLVPDKSKQDYLDTLNRESQRLSNLVEDVLDYARLENHKVRLSPSETDGPALVRALAEMHAERCARDGIEARTENLISDGQRLFVDVDVMNRIAAVLVNNACRHARDGSNPIVLLRVGAENGHTHLDVIDSGPGVDRTDTHTIFKPFRRGRNATASAQGGVGLGLALARSWAQLLGGKLDLIARHDPTYGGPHFRLTIPSQTTG